MERTEHYGAVLGAIETGNQPEALRLLDAANQQYYGGGDSPLTDAEFDALQAAYVGRFGIPLKTRQQVDPVETRDVPGFPGYRVTADGDVLSYWTKGGAIGTRATVLKAHTDKDGYRQLVLMRDRKHCTKRVAAIVALAFLGECPKGMVIRHLDGCNTNDRKDNLAYGTQQQNMDDREAHGNTARGERQGLSKLKEDEVREIIRLRGQVTQEELAARFGCSKQQIANIHQGRQWRHVDRTAGHKHDWPLLSGWLAKAATSDELMAWVDAKTTSPDTEYFASPKWDGMSLVFTYSETGVVRRVLTRGDNGLGVDVTRHFAEENHFPGCAFPCEFGIKYEAVVTWSDLERLNEAEGGELKNPRNTIAGIVSADDSASRRQYVTLVPLDVEWDGDAKTRTERLEFLQELYAPAEDGAPAPFAGNGARETPFYWYALGSGEDVLQAYQEIHESRSSSLADYMIDGVVVEFASDEDIERLGGRSNDCPDYAIAAKFPSMVGRTRVVSLDWDLGNTGRLTPVVNYEPVTMDGRTFSRSSIANMVRFDQLRLAPGSPILIEIRGDILAWVNRDGEDPAGTVPFEAPTNCTFTHNEKGERVFAYVEAPLDGRCERMMVKCGIKGVRIETIFKLVQAGVVTKLADMWDLERRFSQIAAIPGMGESSAEIVTSAIQSKLSKGLWDWEILASVGINGVGRTLAKEVLKLATLDQYIDALTQRAAGDGACETLVSSLHTAVGPERSRIVLEGIGEYTADIRDLCSVALTGGGVHATKEARSTYDGPFYKVVVTGDLERWERDDFKTLIEGMGHKMVGSISSKTDYLITNTPNSGTVKNKKAQELGVPIVTEEQAIEILGIVVEATPAAAVQEQPEMTAESLANFNL